MNTIYNVNNINSMNYTKPCYSTKSRQALIRREKLDSKNLKTISDSLNLSSEVWSEASKLYNFDDFASGYGNNSRNPLEEAFKKYADYKLNIENTELTDEHKKIHIKVLDDKFKLAGCNFSFNIIKDMMHEKFMYKKNHKSDEATIKKYGMAIFEVSRSFVILTSNFLDYMSKNSVNPNSQEDMERLINYVNKDARFGDRGNMSMEQFQNFVC